MGRYLDVAAAEQEDALVEALLSAGLLELPCCCYEQAMHDAYDLLAVEADEWYWDSGSILRAAVVVGGGGIGVDDEVHVESGAEDRRNEDDDVHRDVEEEVHCSGTTEEDRMEDAEKGKRDTLEIVEEDADRWLQKALFHHCLAEEEEEEEQRPHQHRKGQEDWIPP
jgi:hypothetical protein